MEVVRGGRVLPDAINRLSRKKRDQTHPTPVDPRSHVMDKVSHCSVFLMSILETLSQWGATVRVMGIGIVVPGGFQSNENP